MSASDAGFPDAGLPDTSSPDAAPPELPASFRRLLPAARWARDGLGQSKAGVWLSTRFVLKVQPHLHPAVTSLRDEVARLRWFSGRLPVPEVVAFERDREREYLAMTRLRGIPMSHPDAVLHPERMADLLARALRELHALPARDCPFDTSLRAALPLARERVAAGLVDETDFDEDHLGRSAVSVFNELARTRPAEDLVLTHGDPTLENFIVQGEHLSGMLDLGRAGLADRHVDLSIAVRSLRRNLGDEHAEAFLDTYGRERVDPAKLEYYRLLDELA